MYQNIRRDKLAGGDYEVNGTVMNSSASLLQTIQYGEYLNGCALANDRFLYEVVKDYIYDIVKQGKSYYILAVCDYSPGGEGIGIDDIMYNKDANMYYAFRINMLLEWVEFWDE